MSIAIGLGIADFPFSGAAAYMRWVQTCEAGGIDSIWQTDRLVSRQPFLEAMSTMAWLAGATTRLKFGMNVVSVGLRDPLLLAKQCASVDFLSQGRLLPAFGIGNRLAPDWKATGRETRRRGRRTDEGLELISRLWAEDEVSFEGEFYHYDRASISPKPAQKRLPLWIGGSSEAAVRRTARFGTGWQGAFEPPNEIARVVERIKVALAEAGRRIDEDHYGAAFAFRFGAPDDGPARKYAEAFQARFARDPRQNMVAGDGEAIVRRLQGYVDAGISKFVLRPIGAGDDDLIEQTERLIADVCPWLDVVNGKQAA